MADDIPSGEGKESVTYEAGCHCGYIKFDVTLAPGLDEYPVAQCNCSACTRFGYLLVCKSLLSSAFYLTLPSPLTNLDRTSITTKRK